ncbi:hypothetical protein [Pseudogemmobacter sonorensis]|uniref:hypothetical protein n=1 Tax=Pseudogemmobacter sonorensis TaxID=2989681 RepID=UPI003683CA27
MHTPETFPLESFLSAIIIGLLGVPVIFFLYMADKREIETGRPNYWHVSMMLALCGFPAATMFLPWVPRFLLTLGVMSLGIVGGASFSYYALKLAPKAYWAIRYFIWKLTGLWPNR